MQALDGAPAQLEGACAMQARMDFEAAQDELHNNASEAYNVLKLSLEAQVQSHKGPADTGTGSASPLPVGNCPLQTYIDTNHLLHRCARGTVTTLVFFRQLFRRDLGGTRWVRCYGSLARHIGI